MGMFDDLVPQTGGAAPKSGMFDDLVPGDAGQAQQARTAAASRPKGGVRNVPESDSTWSDVKNAGAQAFVGFNEGLGKSVGRLADTIPFVVNRVARGQNPLASFKEHADTDVHPVEGFIHRNFVEPHPQAETRPQQIMRAGGGMVGENVGPLAATEGMAAAGVRSGVTMAEKMAANAGSKVSAPAADVAYDVNAPLRSTFERYASKIPQAGREVANALNPVNIYHALKPTNLRATADSVLDWVAANPGKAAVGDVTGAFQSGAGGQIGKNVAADNGADEAGQHKGEVVGQFLTPSLVQLYRSLAPSMLAGRAVKKGYDSALEQIPTGDATSTRQADKLAYANREGKYANPDEPAPTITARQEKMDAGAKERTARTAGAVGEDLNRIITRPDAAANLSEAEALKKTIPGFNPGVAKATNDPALLNLQKRFESEATGDELRAVQGRDDASRQSLRNKFESLAPRVGDNPQDIVHGAEAARVQGEQTRINSERGLVGIEQDATNRRLRAAGEALPDAERADQGARFREVHAEAERASSDRTSQLRREIANQDTPVVIREGRPATYDEYLPTVPVTPEVPPVTRTVGQVLNRRAEINQDTRDISSASARTVDDMRRMRRLQTERQNLDARINGINEPGMAAYRDYYRDQHVPKFEEGAGRDVNRYDRFGYDKNKVPDEKVLAQFGGPNNISAARQFTATHGQNPEMVQLMADHQLGRLKKETVDPVTGTMREGAVEKFLTKNRELLDALPPNVRTAVVARNPADLHVRLGELEQRQRALADQTVASRLGTSPEKTLDGALNDWQVMRDLKQTVRGNPQHEAALTRAVMERAPDPTDAVKFGQWLEGHDRVLRQVVTPQHLADLKSIAKAAEIQGRLPRPKGAVEEPKSAFNGVKDVTGTSVPTALTTMTTLARGRSNPVYEVSRLVGNVLNKFSEKQAATIWKEALFNPDIAQTLKNAVQAKRATPMQYDKMYSYLAAVGAHDAAEDLKPREK